MTRLIRVLGLGAAVGAVLATGSLMLDRLAPNAASADPGTRAAIAVTAPKAMALGRIEAASELITIAAPASQDSGRIAEIRVQQGDWVEQGAIIAVLDNKARLEASVRQAEATLQLRRATLARTSADLDSQEKTLSATLEQQAAQRDRSRWDLDKLEQLQRSGLYRETALVDKRLALESASSVLESARLQLERNRKRGDDGLRIDEGAARAEVAVAEAALERARADLEFATVRAPISGRIIRRLARPGEQIGQNGVVEIADTRAMVVRAEVFESDLRYINVGASAKITSRALDTGLTGRVEQVGLKVSRQSIVGEDPATALDARVIDVLVRLDDASAQRVQGLIGLQVRLVFDADASS